MLQVEFSSPKKKYFTLKLMALQDDEKVPQLL